MKRFKFNKLIRDKYFESMISNTEQNPSYRELNDDEFVNELMNKVVEEATELKDFSLEEGNVTEELADIVELINEIQAALGISDEDLETAIKKKQEKAGGFSKRIFMKHNEVNEDSEWADYYRKYPDKYPEIN